VRLTTWSLAAAAWLAAGCGLLQLAAACCAAAKAPFAGSLALVAAWLWLRN